MMHQYSPGCLGQPQYSSERKNIHEDFMDKLAGNLPWLLSIFPTPERFNQAINGGLSDLHPHQKVYLKEVLLPLIIKASEEKTDKMTAVVSENTQVKDASPKKDTSPKAVNRTLSSSSSTLLRAPVNAPAEQISPTPAATFEYGMGMGCSMQ
jgi:hypothetical protein